MPIGKMYHCGRRGRGIHIRGVTPTNIIFNKDCTYQRMLEKCCSIYSTEEREKATFYIADSRGVPIWTSDYLVIDGEDGKEQKVPWTLMKYIEYSHFKYASKAKFFCVRNGKFQCDVQCHIKLYDTILFSQLILVTLMNRWMQMRWYVLSRQMVLRVWHRQMNMYMWKVRAYVHQQNYFTVEEYSVSDKNANETEGTYTKSDNAPFTPKFIVIKKSHYRNGEASFIVTDQESALTGHMGDNVDVKDDVEKYSGSSSLNPCHYGCIFSGIDIEGINN